MTQYLPALMIGVVASLAASVVWLLALSRLRPKFEISPLIAVQDTDEGAKRYVLKVINRTKRPIINVRCRLSIVSPKSVPCGLVFNNRALRLKIDEVFCVDRYDQNDADANYAWRFVCLDDLETDWDEARGGYVIFRVLATDSLSGLSTYRSQRFYTKRDCLRVGSHKFGDNLGVE